MGVPEEGAGAAGSIRLAPMDGPFGSSGKSSGEWLGPYIHAAFVSQGSAAGLCVRGGVDGAIAHRVFPTEEELARRLPRRPELRMVAHQGRAFPSERPGIDRATSRC